MPSNHLIFCHPLLLLPLIFPSIRVFSNELALRIRWPKDWSFSFNISPSSEHPGLISFRDGLIGSPCSPRDSQASSPPQFKSISSLVLSFLYSPTLPSIHDYWKNQGKWFYLRLTNLGFIRVSPPWNTFTGGSVSKESACNARDMGLIPG